MTDSPKPPPGLSQRARALWRSIVASYELQPHHLELLRTACEALTRMEQAGAILAEFGPVVLDRFGMPRKHPAVSVEEAARIAYLRGMRELNLEDDVPEGVRPPRARGRRF